jgi:hypothetical protein
MSTAHILESTDPWLEGRPIFVLQVVFRLWPWCLRAHVFIDGMIMYFGHSKNAFLVSLSQLHENVVLFESFMSVLWL